MAAIASVYYAALEQPLPLFSTRPSAIRGIRGFRFDLPNSISREAIYSSETPHRKLHSLLMIDTYSVHYRDDAKKLEEWGRSQNATTLVDFSSRRGDVENILKGIAETVQSMENFTYSQSILCSWNI